MNMNKPSKCKNCQWYGKPYWSIVNPCDNCPRENDNITIVQIDGTLVFKESLTEEEIKKTMEGKSIFELTIEEKDKEIERLQNIIDELEKYINKTKLEEFEKSYGKRYGKTFTQAEAIICNMILNKLKELKDSDE